MKLTQYKNLVFTGIALMAFSFATYGQTTGATGTSGATGSKAKKSTKTTSSSTQSQPGINDAGSSAQVRHDRTGSLDPGHAKSSDTKGATGPTGK